jgi:hypothetical protein
MSSNDCVFYTDGDQIKSAGFKINSSLLEKTIKHASDLAIPAGLFYQPNKTSSLPKCDEMTEVFNEALYSKLYNLVNINKKLTKKHQPMSNRKTKKKSSK